MTVELDDLLPGAIFVHARDKWVAQLSMNDTWIMDGVCKNYTLMNEPPNYPVPAIALEIIFVVINGECIAIDILNKPEHGLGPWDVVAMFDKY